MQRINNFWIQDCSAAIENMLLLATDLGIGTCWCGVYPVSTVAKRLSVALDLEPHIIPLAIIHFGYTDEKIENQTKYKANRVHIID